jgi:hypothetical protein
MAEVFEAVLAGDQGFRRRVAIKRLLPDFATDEALSRMFLEEARIASALHHGGIVAIHDYGILDGLPFQVLELVDGMDAGSLVDRGRELGAPMPEDVAIYVTLEIAHALEYAHAYVDEHGKSWGVVHRDVKPANVLVSWSGDVKLGDFGIAFARDRLEKTMGGVAKGTPAYMAPEQLLAAGVDRRADIFSLGCTLHALLTGDSPVISQESLRGLLIGEELALSAELPTDIAAVIARAVRADKGARFASASDMARELGPLLARRLAGDGKTAMLNWLGRVRPPAKDAAPKAGRFDALIGLEIAPSADDGASRTFQKTAPVSVSVPVPVAPPRRAARWPLLAAALALGAAGVAGWRLTHRAAPVTVAAAPVAPAPPSASAVESAHVELAPPVSESVPDAGRAPVASRRASVTRTAHPAQAAPALPPAEEVGGVGTVAVGGSSARGAQILVDGRSQGLAPKYLDLGAGSHRIELLGVDGSRTGPATIQIEPRHTRTSPLRWP